MEPFRLACNAMACRFEIALYGDSPMRLRAAAQEALAEVERLDALLSRFRGSSELSGVNTRAADEPVRITPELFGLLLECRQLHELTAGAFDITVGPLMECWRFREEAPCPPDEMALSAALARVGMRNVLLDPDTCTVRFAHPGMSLDLGGIGKGYAVACAADVLRELEIPGALLHAATSSVYAIGAPPEEEAWQVAVRNPHGETEPPVILALRDCGLSVSGVHGRGFTYAGHYYGHVLDPRTGRPSQGPPQAAVVHPSPVVAEALSTALLIGGKELAAHLQRSIPEATLHLF
ncbi:MAG TPA: FAD:protein FMN transferase [Armatimonadota bacterium]|nr:FAD:protein FMN transferase [Armatimonadota bacterium]